MTVCSLDVHLSLFGTSFSMSCSNYCFLICIQISQEAGQVVWYSHLFKNFQQFVVVHTVKGFGIVNKAEIDVFWNSLAFSMIQWIPAIWFLIPLHFLNPAWTSGSSWFMYCWRLTWRILSIILLVCEMSAIPLGHQGIPQTEGILRNLWRFHFVLYPSCGYQRLNL